MSTVKLSLKNKPRGVSVCDADEGKSVLSTGRSQDDAPVVPGKDTLRITLPDGHEVPTGCIRSATLNMQPQEAAILVVEFFVQTENES